jgi:hypothetical protein
MLTDHFKIREDRLPSLDTALSLLKRDFPGLSLTKISILLFLIGTILPVSLKNRAPVITHISSRWDDTDRLAHVV